MKLRSVYLHPFAGIQDKRFDLSDGLNVILGPNEAGKSTLYHAILHGLLTTTLLTTAKLEDIMGIYFPASGGDVIRVDVELIDVNGNEILIQKTWKKGNKQGQASLHLSDDTEITNEESVQNHIEKMLPVSPATLRTILLADQSGLHHTMHQMKQDGQVRKELGDVLRKSFMETGGVSVDRFKEILDQKYDDFFKRWDREQQYPENNRGIKNPYKVGTGKVVEAFYKKEQLQIDLDEALRFEDELDALNEKLTALISQQKKNKEKFDRLNPLKEGIQKRQLKEQQLETANERRTRLLEASRKWPVYEEKIENLQPKLDSLNKKIEKLEEEQKKAQNKHKAGQLKQQIQRIENLSGAVKQAEKDLKEAKKVEYKDLKALRELKSEISKNRTKIEAAKLTIRLESETDQALLYTEAGKDQNEIPAKKGESVEKTASGGFTLKTDNLNIKVFAGEGDLEETIQVLEMKEAELSEHLENLGVDSIQDAESFAELYRQKQNTFKQGQKSYKDELGDQDISELKEKLAEYGDLSQVRAEKEITDDLIEAKTERNDLNKEAEEAKHKLEEWKDKYESYDDLVLELADTSKSIKERSQELEELPSLPEGYDSSDEFIQEVNQLDQSIQDLKEQIFEKKQERTELEAKAPETSSEELQKLLEDAVKEFERINKQAETLANVRDKALELIVSMDSDTYKGLETSFIKWLEKMAGQRFSTIEMDNDMPAAFKAHDAPSLTYELLSHGTKDTVALAWRFALTEKFLDDNTGFIILDDPMVDIDPERRKNVVKAINEFSERYQTVVMTCHPDHAEELTDRKNVFEF